MRKKHLTLYLNALKERKKGGKNEINLRKIKGLVD